ncbi:MAG: bacterioferritin [Alcaligenaceae bacterium]|nr:MAG: bacterioferritin [Alcaligenaceae bacterium]
MYICICNAVTERQVRASVDAGATTLDDLHIDLGVASCCGRCADTAAEYLPGGRCSSVCAPHDVVTQPFVAPVRGAPAANPYPVIHIAAA